MRYYKETDENGKLLSVGVGQGGEEIDKDEYDALVAEIVTKWQYANKLYRGEIKAEDVPSAWLERVLSCVDERTALFGAYEGEAATVQDYLDALSELGVSE